MRLAPKIEPISSSGRRVPGVQAMIENTGEQRRTDLRRASAVRPLRFPAGDRVQIADRHLNAPVVRFSI